MEICTNSGVTITNCSNILIASDGKTYTLSGQMLLCDSRVISYNCQSKKKRSARSLDYTVDEGSKAYKLNFASTLIFCGMRSSPLIL